MLDFRPCRFFLLSCIDIVNSLCFLPYASYLICHLILTHLISSTASASITNVRYENIRMTSPSQFAIWIGPAQQTGQPCSLAWPWSLHAECKVTGHHTWENITLKDIFIDSPRFSPGVLLGNTSNPMRNIIFDNVVVTHTESGESLRPWGDSYLPCEGMTGISRGRTAPVPTCLLQQ
jgi:hypothetical protein